MIKGEKKEEKIGYELDWEQVLTVEMHGVCCRLSLNLLSLHSPASPLSPLRSTPYDNPSSHAGSRLRTGSPISPAFDVIDSRMHARASTQPQTDDGGTPTLAL